MSNSPARRFPFLHIEKHKNNFECTACIAMKSIQAGELILNSGFDGTERQYLDRLHPHFLHERQKEFLASVAGWSANIVLEVRISSYPNLLHKAQSRIDICLILRSVDRNEAKVKERICATYLALFPLLQTYMPEAEFVPVTDHKGLGQHIAPYNFRHAVAVCRKQENLDLTVPYAGIGSIGFGPRMPERNKNPLTARHFFPWCSSESDWSYLLSTMQGQLDPVRLILRIRPTSITTDTASRLSETISKCEMFLSGSDPTQVTLNNQAESLRHVCTEQLANLKNGAFNLGVFMLAPAPIDSSLTHYFIKESYDA